MLILVSIGPLRFSQVQILCNYTIIVLLLCHKPVGGSRKLLDTLDESSDLRCGEPVNEVLASPASPPDLLLVSLIISIIIIRVISIARLGLVLILPATTSMCQLLRIRLKLTQLKLSQRSLSQQLKMSRQ